MRWSTGTRTSASIIVASTLALGLVGAGCGDDDNGDQAAGGSGSKKAEKVVEISMLMPGPAMTYKAMWVSNELGFFADEGVKVTYKPTPEDVSAVGLLENGNVDIAGIGALETLGAVAEGHDLKTVYDQLPGNGEGMITTAKSGMTSTADLKGKTIGLASEEERFSQKVILALEDLKQSDVKTVITGEGGPAVADALKKGKIDAYMGSVFDFSILKQNGIDVMDITPAAMSDIVAVSMVLTPKTIEKLGDKLEGFLRAWAKGAYVGLVNRDLAQALSKKAKPEEWTDDKAAQGLWDIHIGLARQDDVEGQLGGLSEEAWSGANKFAVTGGLIDKEVPLDTVLDRRFLKAANDWDRAEVAAVAKKWASENLP